MKTVDLSNVTDEARQWVEQAASGPVILKDNRGRTFVLAELDDADAEAMSLAENTQLLEIINRSRARAEKEGWMTTEQLREDLGL